MSAETDFQLFLMRGKGLSGISSGFPKLSQSYRQVAHVLLTRPPLTKRSKLLLCSLDLHVLGTPPAFVLSQDQTLQKEVDVLKICLLSSSGSHRLVENNLPPSTCKHVSSEEHFPFGARRSPSLFYVDASFCSVFKEHYVNF